MKISNKTKFNFSIIFVSLYVIVSYVFNAMRSGIESSIAVNQLKDSIVIYGFTQKLIMTNIIPNIMLFSIIGILILTWIGTFKKMIEKEKAEGREPNREVK